MIELSPEQRHAVASGVAVRVVDPATNNTYVLVRAEVYERLSEPPEPLADMPSPRIPPMILRSQQAFWRDLPELLKDHRNHGKWAAYHGEKQVTCRRSDVEAYQECFRRGLKENEFYVGRLEADPDGIPPWGTYKCDWSLFEVTEGTSPDGT